jgi:hypothetical protein
MFGGCGGIATLLLTWAPDGDERSASLPAALYPGKQPSVPTE